MARKEKDFYLFLEFFKKGIVLKKRVEWIVSKCIKREVLDVGCVGKSGIIHSKIAKVAKECVGIDIDVEKVKMMRRLGYNVIVADAENFSLNRKFDVIVAGELIEHLSNPGLFLDCVRKHLKKTGYLVLTTPNARALRIFLNKPFTSEHVQLYNLRALTNLLQRHGFQVTSIQFFWSDAKNLLGKLYDQLFVRFFPGFAVWFGVTARPS